MGLDHLWDPSDKVGETPNFEMTRLGTWPASISVWNFLAAIPDDVKIAAPFPYLQKQGWHDYSTVVL